MTARGALAEVEGLEYRLALRPGGLRLTGEGEPPPELLALIQERRDGLLSFLEEEARRWKAHEESLAAGRITPFPAHLVPLVHPSGTLWKPRKGLKRPGMGIRNSQQSRNHETQYRRGLQG